MLSLERTLSLSSLVALSLLIGCATGPEEPSDAAVPPAEDEPLGTATGALTTDDVMQCAQGWVDLAVPYCGGVNGGTDYICGGTCNRPSEPWDNFRTDCSGFVSWCWQIPSDPTTNSYMNDNGSGNGWHTIAIDDLQAGDAVVCDGHIKLFSHFASSASAEVYEESNCGKVAHKSVQTFTRSGGILHFAYDSRAYHPIRRNGILPPVRIDGYVDSAGASVKGWAADLDASDQSILVDLYFGAGPGSGYGVQFTAADARPDVAAALGISPNHGFDVPTPLYFCDGAPHSVFGFGHSVKDGTAMPLKASTSTLSCPPTQVPEGLLRHVVSQAVLTAWSFEERRQLAWMTPEDRAAHQVSNDWPNARKLGITADGSVWVVDGDRRRHVVDPTSFAAWGFDSSMLETWGDTDASKYILGLDLPAVPALVQQVGDPAVYVLDVDPAHLGNPPNQPPGANGSGGAGSNASSGSSSSPADPDATGSDGKACTIASSASNASDVWASFAFGAVALVAMKRKRQRR